ncbi:XdhC family aldehyde oxidoreductase maturation factor [Thermodesulfobacteriota bacterium]
MKEIYQAAVKLVREGHHIVLATIIFQQGPSPRGIGTKCLILEDGSLVGTIGGGALEAETVEESRRVLEKGLPSRLFFSLTGSDVAETDMLCGGEVEVFLEPITPETTENLSVYKEAARTMGRGGAGMLVSLIDKEYLSRGKYGAMLFVDGGAEVGSLSENGRIEAELRERLEHLIESDRPGVVSVTDISGNLLEIFVETFSSAPILYIFGGGHVSKQIVPLASKVGFETVVIDDRKEFADKKMFPEAAKVQQFPFEGVMEKLKINDSSYLVIVTRGHIHDKIVLEQTLKTDACYIGMIGSKRKRQIIYEKLLEEGFSDSDLARVHSPIGLEIGADSPEEIGVSIVAELIKVRAGA